MTAWNTADIAPARGGSLTRVFLAATSYPANNKDWKGLFIQRMVEGLARRTALQVETWCPPGPLPVGVGSALQDDDGAWLAALAARGGIAHLLRRQPVRGMLAGLSLVRRLRRALRVSDANVFHINWLQNALALPDDGRPVLVTALGTDMRLLRVPGVVALLRRRFARRPVVLSPNADWMVPVLEAAFGDVARVHCIAFGIDRAWYEAARTPLAPARWLCVSRITAVKLGRLFEWAAPLFADGNRELHLIGPRQESNLVIPNWVHFHGPATPEQLCAEWFPQATGLLSLSTHPEGRPQVMLEAMAAGLPILASRLPAHEDLIAHGGTGWICADAPGLADGIRWIEDMQHNHDIGMHARQVARARFGDWDDCAGRYAAQYARLLQDRCQ